MIYINPDFMEQGLPNQLPPAQVTHFNPVYVPTPMIHMNPEFLQYDPTVYWSYEAEDNGFRNETGTESYYNFTSAVAITGTTQFTQQQAETYTQQHNIYTTVRPQIHETLLQEPVFEEPTHNDAAHLSPFVSINKHTLVRSTALRTHNTKILPQNYKKVNLKRLQHYPKSYKLDNGRGQSSEMSITATLPKPEGLSVVAKYAQRWLTKIRMPNSKPPRRNIPSIHYNQNKKLQFKNINGVLYKLTRNKLERKDAIHNSTENQFNPDQYGIGDLPCKVSQTTNTSTWTSAHATMTEGNHIPQYSVEEARKRFFKNNIPCPTFQRTGRCVAQESGRCSKKHDKQQVAICSKYLRGECANENCLLSHNVSYSKMPVCKFYLQGVCIRDKCPYLHKKLSSKTELCQDFLRGFCQLAEKCGKWHMFVCSQFQRNGECKIKNCIYCVLRTGEEHEKEIHTSKAVVVKKIEKKQLPKKKVATITRRYFGEVSQPNEVENLSMFLTKETVKDENLVDGANEPKNINDLDLPIFIPF